MLFFFPGAVQHPARKSNDLRTRADMGLKMLTQIIKGQDFTNDDLDSLQGLIGSLPTTGAESDLAASRLCKAQRYLRSNERGAARYELQLLLDRLQSC